LHCREGAKADVENHQHLLSSIHPQLLQGLA
jgi:hypothetical protein